MKLSLVVAGLTRNPASLQAQAKATGCRIKSGMTGLLLFASASAMAQLSPVGLWRNIDDKTGEVKAEIRIADSASGLNGRIEKILRKDARPDEKCDKCSDERKDKPMVGLEIVRGSFGPFGRTQTWLRAQ